MRQTKVAKRYAKAIFDLSLETGKLEEVRQDLELIMGTEHPELKVLLASPIVAGEKKQSIFEAIFAKHIQPLTVSFFKLIFAKGRSVAIDDIIDAFKGMYRENKGIKVVELTTAVEVSDAVKTGISEILQKGLLLSGKKIELKTKIDSGIIGGLVVQIDDQLFDASIKHDLQVIRNQFVKNMYVSDLK